MFDVLKLDDRSYREIEEEAVFRIPRECPQWTNYNPSDPGMTLVQLFSWLTEVQQYHLSQPSPWKRRKYLKLLGAQIRHLRPAKGTVTMEPGLERMGKQFPLLQGTRFWAGDLAFETLKKEWVHPARLIGACMVQGDTFSSYHNIGNEYEKQMQLYPFGQRPEKGNQCCLILDGPLSHTWKTDIFFDICTEYAVTRNPAKEGFLPLAKLKWEYYGREGWETLQVEEDGTYGFLQSGRLRVWTGKEMAREETFDAYEIRVTLLEHELDVAPLIRNIYLNEIEVRQQYSACDYEECEVEFSKTEDFKTGPETAWAKAGIQGEPEVSLCTSLYLAEAGKTELYVPYEGGWRPLKERRREKTAKGDVKLFFPKPAWAKGRCLCRLAVFEEEMEEKRILGTGNAFANQEFFLHMEHLLYEAFEILVYDREAGCYMEYWKTEDFDGCTSEDRAYLLDPEQGKLVFGDCGRGMAPEGEIRILRLKFSRGRAGNIKAGRIRECQGAPELLVKQYKRTEGGREEETVSECLERFRQELKKIHRGVTYSDYEKLVKKAPGLLILDSRVILPGEWEEMGVQPLENEVSIVVQPLSSLEKHGRLSEAYRRNLSRFLEERKMLGTRIRLLNPEYIAVSVYAEVVVWPQFSDAGKQMEERVREYLNEQTWKIGKPVLSSVLYGLLDTLPCVRQVKSLSVSAQGRGCRHRQNGDVALPPNGLAYGKDLDFGISTGDEGGR